MKSGLPLLVYVLQHPPSRSLMVVILTMRDYSNTMLIGGGLGRIHRRLCR